MQYYNYAVLGLESETPQITHDIKQNKDLWKKFKERMFRRQAVQCTRKLGS